MPELPDLVVFKKYLDSTALHKRIDSLDTHESKVLEGISERSLSRLLNGRKFRSSRTHGKNLFVELDDGHWLRLHFGMTGNLKYYMKKESEPEYKALEFRFKDNDALVYLSKRLLGKVELTDGPEESVKELGLGPDAMEVSLDRFREIFGERRGAVKSTLMNQGLMAGIGNVYSDEILFQAKIHPKTKFKELSGDKIETLYNTMREALEIAIANQADPDRFPDTCITPLRWEGAPCPRNNGRLKKIKVSQRSAFICPECQKQ
jgi:formamidopyrimidine-DNA glycosylase